MSHHYREEEKKPKIKTSKVEKKNKVQSNGLPEELDPSKESDPTKKKIKEQIQTLDKQYKSLITTKQQLAQQLQELDDKILKAIGAYQELKKLLDDLSNDKKKDK